MYRAEIIANQSVQDDIVEVLEENIPGILYTTVPLVTGRGKDDYKLGTATWPETNFMMISYVEDKYKDSLKKIIAAVKEKFPDEGIKLFFVKGE
ncbi:PG0541 family transporter-associated protein [Treponema sp.]|uniref:PG0541 family transporter-associated protein n=1 Tax=Treponema sp. TaxID=166 RepID=UPI0025CDB3BA|nr:PG0541 family transporter-associated protein [Treponema sp.]MCR5218622.1 hypothetical protein [Treponema sp.]